MWVRILLTALLVIGTHQVERDQIDSNVQQISQFLLQLIGRYDDSGKGSIAIEKYPEFLAQVLIQGHAAVSPGTEIPENTKTMLLEAAQGFTKKYNTTEVGVQDFYFDIIKQFTTYLLEQEEKYTPVIEMFFGDTPFADTPNEGYGEEAQSEEAGKEEAIEL